MKLQHLRDKECKYNFRLKLYPNPDGTSTPVEAMWTENYIFNPDGVEATFTRDRKEGVATSEEDKIQRSKARAKSRLTDIIMSNSFRWFVTLTLDVNKIDRTDYSAVIKKLNTFLGNRVRRVGLAYVGVPELHKKGGIHFHFLTNDSLSLADSGTVLQPSGYKKPVKRETAQRNGHRLEDCRTVYNVEDWSLGFSTAIELQGDRLAVARYVGKYISKGEEKVGGRWYYSGGDLMKPLFEYDRVDIEELQADYELSTPNGRIYVKKL